jgi:hypothetical protein
MLPCSFYCIISRFSVSTTGFKLIPTLKIYVQMKLPFAFTGCYKPNPFYIPWRVERVVFIELGGNRLHVHFIRQLSNTCPTFANVTNPNTALLHGFVSCLNRVGGHSEYLSFRRRKLNIVIRYMFWGNCYAV